MPPILSDIASYIFEECDRCSASRYTSTIYMTPLEIYSMTAKISSSTRLVECVWFEFCSSPERDVTSV